ncbi:ABC transporter ATP-binding protein [Spiroplasma chinense]|nr:ABC transporter ATP-binding protein [Spiroplasma chinense]
MAYSFSYIINKAIEGDYQIFLIASICACIFLVIHLISEFVGELILNHSLEILNTLLRDIVAYNIFRDKYDLKIDSGQFLNLSATKINLLERNYFRNTFLLTKSLLGICASFALLIYISWLSLVTVLCFSVFVVVVPMIMTKKNQKAVEVANFENDNFLQHAKDAFNSYWTFWSLNITEKLVDQMTEGSRVLEKKNKDMKNVMSLNKFLNRSVLVFGQVSMVIIFSYYRYLNFLEGTGIIATLNTIGATYVFFGNDSIVAFTKILAHDKVIKQDYKKLAHDDYHKTRIHHIHKIEYKNLAFKYGEENNKSLKNFNLKIREGEKVLVRGESGSGKTMLIKHLFNPVGLDSGTIFLNNILVHNVDLRDKVAFISQDSILNKGSILENINVANQELSQKEIEKYFEMVGLGKFLKELPHGLETQIADNALTLSGGERQRLSIIRSLISNKDWYFVDEIISALDQENAKKVLDIFLKDKHKTVIMVSHKLDGYYLGLFDRIIDL